MANTPYVTTSASANFQVPGPVDVAISSSDYLGFFGTSPVAKQGGSALATLSLGTLTATTPYGFASKADGDALVDRKITRLNSSHTDISRMPSSA